jgi:tetratricopeptide (TPR) repeat protein
MPSKARNLFFSFILTFTFLPARSQDSLLLRSDKLLSDIKDAPHDSIRLKLYTELIDLNTESRPSLVSGWVEKAVAIARKNNLPAKQLAFELKELRALNIQGQFTTTLDKGKQIAPLLEKTGTPLQKAAYLLSLGNANQRTGNYDMAATLFTQAIDVCEKNEIRDIEVRAAMNLGNLYQFLNRYDEMLLHLQRTLVKAERYNLAEDIPMIKFNISNAEAHLNNFGKAIDYLLEVLPYYQKTNNQYALGLAYANLSWCYFKSQKRELALDYAYKSYGIRSALKDEAGLAHLEFNLGRIYLENARYDSSLKYATSSLQRSIPLKLITDIRDNYETLALLNERQGNFAEANKYLRKFYDWKDSIYLKEKDQALGKEFSKYKATVTDKMTSDLEAAKRRIAVYRVSTFALAAALVLVLLALWLYRQKRNKRKYIATIPSREHDYRKEIDDLRNERAQLVKELDLQKATDITELRDMISSNKLHSDAYWNEFLLLFSKVYPAFFERMKQEYPVLNQNELRISALIKLNHSITDMAKALNITVDSARKARYRLYKKIGLSNDQELIDTIIRL